MKHVLGGEVAIDIMGESDDSQGGGSSGLREGVKGVTGNGIEVSNTGGQDIDIDVSGRVSTTGGGVAISSSHSGSGRIDIAVTGQGEVSSDERAAINVLRSAGGPTKIDISGEVSSTEDTAIHVLRLPTGTGPTTVDISGSVSSGNGDDDYAISIDSSGIKTLILRPGFSFGGSGKVTSSGSGDSILKLAASKPGVTSTATPNAVHLDKLR